MRATITTLALAGIGLSGIGLSGAGQAFADSRNLSCITEEALIERHVIRDCDRDEELVIQPIPEVLPPSPPPTFMHDGGRKADGPGRDHGARGGASRGGGAGGGSPNGSPN